MTPATSGTGNTVTQVCPMRPISPESHNGDSIRIRFSVGGRRYSLSPVPGGRWSDPRDLKLAEAIATRVYNDILSGHFDPTLLSYRLVHKSEDTLALWDAWVQHLRLTPANQAAEYRCIRQMIIRSGNPPSHATGWLINADLASATFNKRLALLSSMAKWAVHSGILAVNPWSSIRRRKAIRQPIQPFSRQDIRSIITWFSKTPWHPYVLFLARTGCRPSEAVGLKWSHLDLDKGTVTIAESCPRDRAGNGYQKVQKGTKTGFVRTLTLPDEVLESLKGLERTDPVFKSPGGHTVSHDNFRQRYWKPCLKSLGLTYRNTYVLRHSVLSHAIDQGTPVTGVAYLAGHVDATMVVRTYGHMVSSPSLPDL